MIHLQGWYSKSCYQIHAKLLHAEHLQAVTQRTCKLFRSALASRCAARLQEPSLSQPCAWALALHHGQGGSKHARARRPAQAHVRAACTLTPVHAYRSMHSYACARIQKHALLRLCTHTEACTLTPVHAYRNKPTHVCIPASKHVYAHARTLIHTQTCIAAYAQTHTRMHAPTHVRLCACACPYMDRVHAHTHAVTHSCVCTDTHACTLVSMCVPLHMDHLRRSFLGPTSATKPRALCAQTRTPPLRVSASSCACGMQSCRCACWGAGAHTCVQLHLAEACTHKGNAHLIFVALSLCP